MICLKRTGTGICTIWQILKDVSLKSHVQTSCLFFHSVHCEYGVTISRQWLLHIVSNRDIIQQRLHTYSEDEVGGMKLFFIRFSDRHMKINGNLKIGSNNSTCNVLDSTSVWQMVYRANTAVNSIVLYP